MVDEFFGFGTWNFFFSLVILTEIKIKDVVEFGRFMKILEHQWKWLKGSLFQCLHHKFTKLCRFV